MPDRKFQLSKMFFNPFIYNNVKSIFIYTSEPQPLKMEEEEKNV